MFLCREATSLSYLPVISVGRRGETRLWLQNCRLPRTAPTPLYSLEWVDVEGVSTLIRVRMYPTKKRSYVHKELINTS